MRDMRKWQQEGWNIRSIFDYALNLHASYLNNKSAPIPEGTRPEVERFLRRLGYRLVLKQLDYDASVAPGAPLWIDTTWENTGVAPPYGDYRLARRLTPAGRAQPLTLMSATSIRGWLRARARTGRPSRCPVRSGPVATASRWASSIPRRSSLPSAWLSPAAGRTGGTRWASFRF